ncbi:hypothetical protein, partial [Streptomyces antimycoticus]|uniref:hypothetical protein n=1 Tax=Streptomyces antimycoticus TaxID=68175 RepID=UPI001F2FB401
MIRVAISAAGDVVRGVRTSRAPAGPGAGCGGSAATRPEDSVSRADGSDNTRVIRAIRRAPVASSGRHDPALSRGHDPVALSRGHDPVVPSDRRAPVAPSDRQAAITSSGRHDP